MIGLNVGCGTHYAPGWVNVDAMIAPNTHPDVQAKVPYPFPDETFERVYLGHVLEHVDWSAIPAFMAEVRRLLAPGGKVLATGPDAYRTIREWRDGAQSWELVVSVLEHQEKGSVHWPEAVHKWNCHADRMVQILAAAGFSGVAETADFAGWPVVNWSGWQCAVRGSV